MTAIPASGYPSNSSRTQADIQTWTENVDSILRELPGGAGENAVAIALTSHSFTPANNDGPMHVIDTQGGAASDTLTNIATTNIRDGQIIGIRITNNARTIQVVNANGGAGQLLTQYGDSPTLSSTKVMMWFKYNLAITSFEECIVNPSGGRSGTVSSVTGPAALLSWATNTTTPTASLVSQSALALFGNNTNGSAAPTFFVPTSTANQVIGINTGGTAYEGKTITAGTGIAVTPAAGSITIANSFPLVSSGQPYKRIFYYHQSLPSDTSFNAFGGYTAGPTITSGVAQTAQITNGRLFLQLNTTTTSGNVAKVVTPSHFETQFLPVQSQSVLIPTALTNRRIWVGFCGSDPSGADSTTNVNIAAFRYSTGAGDTKWQCVVGSTSTTSTATDSGVTVVAGTTYDLTIDFSQGSGTCRFYINGALVATISTNLPAAAGGMIHQASVTTLTTATASLQVGTNRIEQL